MTTEQERIDEELLFTDALTWALGNGEDPVDRLLYRFPHPALQLEHLERLLAFVEAETDRLGQHLSQAEVDELGKQLRGEIKRARHSLAREREIERRQCGGDGASIEDFRFMTDLPRVNLRPRSHERRGRRESSGRRRTSSRGSPSSSDSDGEPEPGSDSGRNGTEGAR